LFSANAGKFFLPAIKKPNIFPNVGFRMAKIGILFYSFVGTISSRKKSYQRDGYAKNGSRAAALMPARRAIQ
jgi:hypothetical protein